MAHNIGKDIKFIINTGIFVFVFFDTDLRRLIMMLFLV